MIKRFSALVAVLLLAGCSSPGLLVARQEMDALPKMAVAPQDGDYGLFVAGDSQPQLDFPLKKDQPIGFRRQEQGQIRWLYAVAGDDHVPLDIRKTYEWRRLP